MNIAEPDWIKCPSCGKDVSYLVDGVCRNCESLNYGRRDRLEYLARALNCKDPKKYSMQSLIVKPGSVEAINFAQVFNPSLDNVYFWGHNGAGKSFLAACMLARAIMQGSSGRMLTAEQLRDELSAGISGAEKQARISAFADYDVLVVDEMGLGSNSDFLISAICNVINAREQREKNGLIFTSNLNLDDLSIYFGSRHIPSRIERIGSRNIEICPRDDQGNLIDWGVVKNQQKLQEEKP